MYDIISFGEFRMLEQALNGLAAITATSSFGEMMRVAFLVGILSFGARAVMTNKWDAIPLLTGFIAYSVMFTPKVTVTVTDAYGSGTVAVANVPIGLAAPLAVTSHVGRFLASTFETAFSVITPGGSMLLNGYMEPLTVLLKMRDGSFGHANSDTTNAGDFERTVTAYIVQCVYYDLELRDGSVPEVTIEKIKKMPNTLDAIKTTFMNISVLTEIPGFDPPGGTVRTCEDAYNSIKAAFDGTWIDLYFDNYLQSKLQTAVNPTAGTAQDRVGAALQAIQLSSFDARMYMVNTLLANVIKKGEAGYAASHGDVASAIIRTTAMEQRNVEWAAEKSLFEKIARPVTAFIEVFMVCGGPIMAFAIAAFGPAGLGTLVKFLMMHVWVCLWMPTMTICNMYLYTQISRYVTNVGNSTGANLLSFGSADDLNAQLQNWVAVGSMLAAATPTLTLMLIWGSNQVATTLASRMHSSGHIDPTPAAPPIVSSAPFVQNQSGFGGNPDMSYTKTGAAQQSISYNNTLVDQLSSAQQRMMTTSSTANAGLARAITSGIQGVENVSFTNTGEMSASGSRGSEVAATYNSALQAGRDSGMGDEKAKRFALGVTSNMSGEGGIGINAAGLKAGVSAGLASKVAADSGVTASESEAALKKMSEGVQRSEGVHARFAEAMSQRTASSSGWSYNHSTGDQSTKDYRLQLAEAQQASKTYGLLAMANQVFGNSTSWTAPQLADNLKTLGGANWIARTNEAYGQTFGHDAKRQQAAVEGIMTTPSFGDATRSMSYAEKVATAQGIVMASNSSAGGGHLFAQIAGLGDEDRTRAMRGMPQAHANSGVAPDAPTPGTVGHMANVGTRNNGVLNSEIINENGVMASLATLGDQRAGVIATAENRSGPGKFFQGGVGAVDSANESGRGRVEAAAGTFAADVKQRQAASRESARTDTNGQKWDMLNDIGRDPADAQQRAASQKTWQAGMDALPPGMDREEMKARGDLDALPYGERMAARYKNWGGKKSAR